ncbi:MAG: hypothetical protein IJW70_04075 [Clostridia bacterium]|nr:hypothetical protein [Clostridia bacterium]
MQKRVLCAGKAKDVLFRSCHICDLCTARVTYTPPPNRYIMVMVIVPITIRTASTPARILAASLVLFLFMFMFMSFQPSVRRINQFSVVHRQRVHRWREFLFSCSPWNPPRQAVRP